MVGFARTLYSLEFKHLLFGASINRASNRCFCWMVNLEIKGKAQ